MSETGAAPSKIVTGVTDAEVRKLSPIVREELTNARLYTLLAMVTGVQALSTFAVLAMPTLATKAAPTLGLGPEAVGYQISVIYIAAATLSSMAGLYVRRLGGVTTSCIALSLSAAGLSLLAGGNIGMALAGSVLIGSAYGLTNPAASHLLFRFAPKTRQNLIFAVKQTGVPLGGMLAASMLPSLSIYAGWQMALLWSTALPVALAALLWLMAGGLDTDREPNAKLTAGMTSGVSTVVRHPMLRALTAMGSLYALLQFCLFTFLVTMLVTEFGWSLVAAGAMATMMQVGGAVGRIAWSVLADVVGMTLRILTAIGLLSAVCAWLLAVATPSWPLPAFSLLLVAFGFCLVGWNGLWMAEIARTSGPGEVGLATGGVLFFTYIGIVAGPSAFATVYKAIGSYATTYALFSVFAVLGAVALMLASARAHGGFRSTP